MSHKRTLIRNALVSALSGLPTCGAHVYPSRLNPLTAADLPAILVTTGAEEASTPHLTAGLPWQRLLEVHLFVVVKALAGYEDTADTIIGEIEGKLFDTAAHNNLGGNALSIEWSSVGAPEMDDLSDKPVIRLPVVIKVTYSS